MLSPCNIEAGNHTAAIFKSGSSSTSDSRTLHLELNGPLFCSLAKVIHEHSTIGQSSLHTYIWCGIESLPLPNENTAEGFAVMLAPKEQEQIDMVGCCK